jgi:hypothetical protein
MVLNIMGEVAWAILQKPIQNACEREWDLSLGMYQFVGEERNISQLQLEASRFGKVKVKPMIL